LNKTTFEEKKINEMNLPMRFMQNNPLWLNYN
jgi:hypothetical protein